MFFSIFLISVVALTSNLNFDDKGPGSSLLSQWPFSLNAPSYHKVFDRCHSGRVSLREVKQTKPHAHSRAQCCKFSAEMQINNHSITKPMLNTYCSINAPLFLPVKNSGSLISKKTPSDGWNSADGVCGIGRLW